MITEEENREFSNNANEYKYLSDIRRRNEILSFSNKATNRLIIKTLGFDLTKLYFKISKDDYYQNVKKLFADTNEFKKNYREK